jgi:hypothetical protein
MTRQEAFNKVKEIAETFGDYGFTAEMWKSGIHIMEADGRHIVGFTVTDDVHFCTEDHAAIITVKVKAFIGTMGGYPDTEELLMSAHRIEGAALLAEKLNSMRITYVETF